MKEENIKERLKIECFKSMLSIAIERLIDLIF